MASDASGSAVERCQLPAIALADLPRFGLPGADTSPVPEPLDATLVSPAFVHPQLDQLAEPPLLVLAHGAGADHQHKNMQNLAAALASCGIATLRFNFPFMQAGKRRVDSVPVSVAALQLALDFAAQHRPDSLPLLGGHSFGGRMATHWAAQQPGLAGDGVATDVRALVLCSFPLHTAGKPSTKRIAHFPDITLPMLFASGDRDDLASPELLSQVVGAQVGAQLVWLATANHGYVVLKRSRPPELGNVFDEIALAVQQFVRQLL